MRGQTLARDHTTDLMQECAFALVRAVDGYDPTKCPSIAPYLMRHIKGAMRRYVLDFARRAAWVPARMIARPTTPPNVCACSA